MIVDPASDPAWQSAMKLAIGEWTNWGSRPRESWDVKPDEEKLAEIVVQLPIARYLLGVGHKLSADPVEVEIGEDRYSREEAAAWFRAVADYLAAHPS